MQTPNLDNVRLTGPLRIPARQYVQIGAGFLISIAFAALVAGPENGLVVAGLWALTIVPVVRGAAILREWKTRRDAQRGR